MYHWLSMLTVTRIIPVRHPLIIFVQEMWTPLNVGIIEHVAVCNSCDSLVWSAYGGKVGNDMHRKVWKYLNIKRPLRRLRVGMAVNDRDWSRMYTEEVQGLRWKWCWSWREKCILHVWGGATWLINMEHHEVRACGGGREEEIEVMMNVVEINGMKLLIDVTKFKSDEWWMMGMNEEDWEKHHSYSVWLLGLYSPRSALGLSRIMIRHSNYDLLTDIIGRVIRALQRLPSLIWSKPLHIVSTFIWS